MNRPRPRSVPKTRDKPRVLGDMAFERQVRTKNLASRAATGVESVVTNTPTTNVYEGASGDQTVKVCEIEFEVENAESVVRLFWIGVLAWNQAATVNAEFYGMLDGVPSFTAGVEDDHVCYTKVTGSAQNLTTTPFLVTVQEGLSVGAHTFAVYAQQSTNPGGGQESVILAGHLLEFREDKKAVV